mmetsp:Transcript_41426/g.81904  ORF Transcript_41426/g.81904 Transcript_41426/m.81904 type:complete len:260 (-) Transcript_41426:62-841(-)
MSFRAPSRMPVVHNIARRTGELLQRTTLCTGMCSKLPALTSLPSSAESASPLPLPTQIVTSADAVSPRMFSHSSTTPSATETLAARLPALERISMASSITSKSSFQSAASVILIARSAANRHWKADFPAKTMLLVSLRWPRFSRNQNFCTSQEAGAVALGSAPLSMARRSSNNLECFSALSSPMRSPKPSPPLAVLSSDSVPASSRIFPNKTACNGEPKSGCKPRQSKLLVSTPFNAFSLPMAKASQIHCCVIGTQVHK